MSDEDAALHAWLLERGLRIEQARIARVRILLAIARCRSLESDTMCVCALCTAARADAARVCVALARRSAPAAGAASSPRARSAKARTLAHALPPPPPFLCVRLTRPHAHLTRAFLSLAGDLLLEQAPYACVTTDDSPACDACGRVADAGAAALKRCTRCRAARYCSADCQARGGVMSTCSWAVCVRARARG
jgi:hypothetical protein